jgi:uncharacterized protein (DUF362 family)
MNIRPVIHFTSETGYEQPVPFHPEESYPELAELAVETSERNPIYAGVRALLQHLGYDAENVGSASWNPLSDLVPEGGTVVLKPNFVLHYNEDPNESIDSVCTHPAVLRPLIDYARKAVGPTGRVIVADAPQYDCDIDVLLESNRLPELLEWYREAHDVEIEFRDLRKHFGRHDNGVVLERRELPGDPQGYRAVDLGDASEFAAMSAPHIRLLCGADYDEAATRQHHSEGRNEYLVSRTVLEADLVINCPKLKTHKKSGVTLSMKNLIGINGDKNWLPHYRSGFTKGGGDEFPAPDPYSRIRRLGAQLARRMMLKGIGGGVFRHARTLENAAGLGERARNGNWHGNDTIWRTCLDLNKILYCGDENGMLGNAPTRRVLNVYDGIIAGDGRGPMGPRAKGLGLLAASEDPAAADLTLAWIMGFDWRKIPVLRESLGELVGGGRITQLARDPGDFAVLFSDSEGARETSFNSIDLNLRLEPHPGWAGHIERDSDGARACAS